MFDVVPFVGSRSASSMAFAVAAGVVQENENEATTEDGHCHSSLDLDLARKNVAAAAAAVEVSHNSTPWYVVYIKVGVRRRVILVLGGRMRPRGSIRRCPTGGHRPWCMSAWCMVQIADGRCMADRHQHARRCLLAARTTTSTCHWSVPCTIP